MNTSQVNGLQVTGKHVLVERLADDNKTVGGLYVPDSAVTKKQLGKIVGLGALVKPEDDPAMDLKVGDIILFANFSGIDIDYDGKKYLMFMQKDILGVVK